MEHHSLYPEKVTLIPWPLWGLWRWPTALPTDLPGCPVITVKHTSCNCIMNEPSWNNKKLFEIKSMLNIWLIGAANPSHPYSLSNSSVLFSSGFPATSKVATVLCAIKIKQLIGIARINIASSTLLCSSQHKQCISLITKQTFWEIAE